MYKKYTIPVLSFFCLILALPFIGILNKVSYDLKSIINSLETPYTQKIIIFSLYQAMLSAVISCGLAIPLALALNRHKNYILVKAIISLCGFSFVIPSTNIMYPVANKSILPDAFNQLEVPNILQLDPAEINQNKDKWINEWLNAS